VKSRLLGTVSACLFSLVTTPSNAALESRLGGQAVYDTDLDITWLSDANSAMTSGYDPDGRMTWDQAQTWIGTLNAANHLGFNDWRLPSTLIPDGSCTDDTAGSTPSSDSTGYNCLGSEMGHLFYNELGGTAGSSILASGDPDLALFTNIQTDLYWSGTEYAPDFSQAWFLLTSDGLQNHTTKTIFPFAWAVRSGDAGKPLFTDVTSIVGITHVSSVSADSFTGGGVAWIDIDNDGWQDLFVPNSEAGQPNYLYHNVGGSFVNISASAGVEDSAHQAAGAIVGDYDADGCDDILVVNGGSNVTGASERNTLLRNNFCDTGNSLTFSDTTVTANLHNEIANSMVASFGDLDQDGDLDLYVANYTPDGVTGTGFCEQNHYYRNNGNGSFTEQAASVNLTDAGCALGLVMSDYDNDGDLDVYITNDFSDPTSLDYVPGTADIFYANQGTDIGGNLLPFTTPANNLTDATNGMGITVGDYDNDGDLDYYATSFASVAELADKKNVLNRNEGNGTFVEVADAVGMADWAQDIGAAVQRATIGWGVVFFDADLDGDLDMYKANGRIQPTGLGTAIIQPNRLFENDGQTSPSFTERAGAAGVDGLVDSLLCWDSGFSLCYDQSRGVAAADYDNDGDIDLFVVNTGQQDTTGTNPLVPQPPRLYQNNATLLGGAWLKVQLEGDGNNRRGIGAKIRVTSTSAGGGITQVREILAGSSHGSTDAFPAHFGFPAGTTVTQLVVEWPAIGGQPAVVTARINLALNQIITVEETSDTDGDGLRDVVELQMGTDPNNPDTDNDGLADGSDGLVLVAALPGGVDANGDGFVDGEADLGTDPTLWDTDTDGFNDGAEISAGSDPLDINSIPGGASGDVNGDGVVNVADVALALRIVFGILLPDSNQKLRGDAAPLIGGVPAPNGIFDLGDVLVIERKALGLVNF